ncbi:MAG: ABC transporter ATP-binding protein [Planctomycetes bacterium]|nr:ABC transporter ATP-binding protein [Planctomycetota bacterium]
MADAVMADAAMIDAPILTIEGLAVSRGGRVVLRGVDVAIAAGEILVVIGPNGSGKSTLVMAAAGLLTPAQGRVAVRGRDIGRLEPVERARLVAYVPQRSELIAPLAVREVVAMGRFAATATAFGRGSLQRPGPADLAAIDDALGAVDAIHLADRRFTELSGGEAQRVVIARALATGAEVLLLDEPTSALDVAHRLNLASLVRRLAGAGKVLMIALHDLAEARDIAGRVLLLVDGGVRAIGPAAEVISAGPIRDAYGVELVVGGGFGYCLPSARNG